jgi:hypothetical protein
MAGIDEIHPPIPVDDYRGAWMRNGRVDSHGAEEADEGERE